MNAATAFYEAAREALETEGVEPNQGMVAGIIGENRTALNSRMSGRHDIGTRKLQAWLRAWRASGRAGLEVTVSADGVTAE
jgi:hypothetical protein